MATFSVITLKQRRLAWKATKQQTWINQHCYTKYSKCPPSAFTQSDLWFLKFTFDLQIASSSKSFLVFMSTSVPGCFSVADWGNLTSVSSTPTMIVKWLMFGLFDGQESVNKVWTVSCKPLLSHLLHLQALHLVGKETVGHMADDSHPQIYQQLVYVT